MSLILDALKRAERDRRAERSTALEDLPTVARPRARRHWGRWLALVALAGAAVVLALGVWRQQPGPATTAAEPAVEDAPPQRPSPEPEASPPAPQIAAPAPAPSRAPAQAPIQARPAPKVIPGTEGIASLDELTPESDVALEPAAPATLPESATPPPQVTARPAPAEPQAPGIDDDAAPPETGAEPEATAPSAAQAPPAAEEPRPVPPALTQNAPVRKLREMPPEYRADFPALTIEVHVFEPKRRFVRINGRRYRAGERLAEGPQVVEIVRDGIVLDYRGQRVLLPLGR